MARRSDATSADVDRVGAGRRDRKRGVVDIAARTTAATGLVAAGAAAAHHKGMDGRGIGGRREGVGVHGVAAFVVYSDAEVVNPVVAYARDIAARAGIDSNSTAEQAQAQEDLLQQALVQVRAISEQYPDLKADAMYIKTMDSVNTYENQVRLSRMTYNDTVTRYNRQIRQIPDSFVAALFHFTEKQYLKENTAKSDMPSLKI